jgi:glycosyltransferase involved in cell wall biosynthesis
MDAPFGQPASFSHALHNKGYMFDANGENRPSVCVIVPCYNEAKRLHTEAFRRYFATHEDIRFLFVDDGSTDATVQVIEQLCSGVEDQAGLYRCPKNGGKAEAVRLGIVHALAAFKPELVGFWDADLATPLEAVQDFIDVLHLKPEIEMVFGARVQLLGRQVHRKAARHYLGRVFATVASNVLGLAIYDTQCGAKLFRVTAATPTVFAEPFLSKWVFDIEIIARYLRFYHHDSARVEGIIFEAPLRKWTDMAGSKLHASDFLVAMWDMLRIRAKYF